MSLSELQSSFLKLWLVALMLPSLGVAVDEYPRTKSKVKLVAEEAAETLALKSQVLQLEIPCVVTETTRYDSDGYHPVGTDYSRNCGLESLPTAVTSVWTLDQVRRRQILKVEAADAESKDLLDGFPVDDSAESAKVRVRVLYIDRSVKVQQ